MYALRRICASMLSGSKTLWAVRMHPAARKKGAASLEEPGRNGSNAHGQKGRLSMGNVSAFQSPWQWLILSVPRLSAALGRKGSAEKGHARTSIMVNSGARDRFSALFADIAAGNGARAGDAGNCRHVAVRAFRSLRWSKDVDEGMGGRLGWRLDSRPGEAG